MNENPNKNAISTAIINSLGLDPNKISIRENSAWVYMLFDQNINKYAFCYFSERFDGDTKIYLVEEGGLGKISKESAEALAKNIRDAINDVNKRMYSSDIRIYYKSAHTKGRERLLALNTRNTS